MSMDFEKAVSRMMDAVKPEYGYVFAPETRTIAIATLEVIEHDFGPDSDNPLEHHNAPHSIDVPQRGVDLGNIFYPYMKQLHRRRFFDGLVLAGVLHDRWQHLGSGANETASARDGIQRIEEADGVLNTKFFKKRLSDGIGATVTEFVDGRLMQPNLLRGSRDPLKFAMAFADRNGIAMEGEERMWHDATNVYYEETPREEQSVRGLIEFYMGQTDFLKYGLNDGLIKAAIARYFPDAQEAVYEDMRDAFHENIVSAHGLAAAISKRPGLRRSAELIAEGVDRSQVGLLVGKLVRARVGHSND